MHRGIPAVLLMATLAAGCGSGVTAGADANPRPIAARMGCTGVEKTHPEMFATNAVDCMWHGDYTQVQTFASSAAQANYWQVGAQFADGTAVVGSGFVVECDNGQDAHRIAGMLGASVR